MTILEGQTLGKYQIIERLGRGGMAEVFKAYQPSLDRYVAIKVLHAHLASDPDFLTRFQREAKAVARLRHPHIIQVYDFDSEGNSYYMVMEYVEGGRSLKEYLHELGSRGEHVPLAIALDIAARIADALEYAHGEGMVHRDIKPANILLPDVRKPLLSDFGIARIIGQTGLTTQGAMIGTPAYMSPEQGRGEPADERSDIYALGIVLYELLTAHPPYDADTPYAIILKHINAPLMSPRRELPNLPEAVERAVLKSLAKDPLDRYADAGQMRDALKQALREVEDATSPGIATEQLPSRDTLVSPVSEAPDTMLAAGTADEQAHTIPIAPSTSKQRGGVPRWGWAVAVGLILLALLAGVLVLPKLGAPKPQAGAPRSVPQAEEIPPEVEARLAEGFDALLRWDQETAFPIFDALLAENPDLPDALAGHALASMMNGDTEAANADLARLRELGGSTPRVELAFGFAESWAPDGDDDQALAHFNAVIDSCVADESVCLMALQERANINRWYTDDPSVAMADMDRAVELAPDELVRADILSGRAELRFSTGDAEGAIGDMVEAYRLTEAQEWRPWYLETAAFYAVFIGDIENAQDIYTGLLDHDPQNPSLLAGQGYIAYRMGDADRALELADIALERHPDSPQAHYLTGLILLNRGDYPGAIAAFERVVDESDPTNYIHPFYRVELGHELHYEMARAYFEAGDLDQAMDHVDQSLAVDGWWPGVHILKAKIYEERGDIEHARVELASAKQIAQERGWGAQAAAIEIMLGELDQ